jgi:transposase InsO family protein
MAEGMGTIQVELELGKERKITSLLNVLHVPDLDGNLISVNQIVSRNFKVIFDRAGCSVARSDGEVVARAKSVGGLYKLAGRVDEVSLVKTAKASSEDSLELWHRRFGHLNVQSIKTMSSKGLVRGLTVRNDEEMDICKGCIQGKQHRQSFPHGGGTRASDILEIIHSDVCGPMNNTSLGGAKYFLTFIDDKSRKTFVYFLKSKDEVFPKFKEFKALVENQTGKRIKTLRSDNGGEYVSGAFNQFLKENGIRHQKSIPYTPQQNGVAERANRTIVERARSMLHSAELNYELWAEAVFTAVYLKNRSPTTALLDMTPQEAWSGKKPSVNHLRVFGCKAYAHIPNHQRTKLESKSKELIFVGYSTESKGYRLYDPTTKTVKLYRDVIFDEGIENSNDDTVFIELDGVSKSSGASSSPSPPSPKLSSSAGSSTIDSSDISVIDIISEDGSEEPRIIPQPRESPKPPKRNRKPPQRYGFAKKAMVIEEPSTFEEAMESEDAEQWVKAAKEEYDSIIKNKTWSLVDLPPGRKAIGCKWVFKVKYDSKGNVERYKCRLVAKGYSQVEGIDFNETFAPVAKFNSIRLLLALAAQYDLEIHQMDVKTAFLNGELEEEIYMEQPNGFVIKGKENKVCKLQRSLYGLKQAGRSWYQKIDSCFEEIGLKRTHADNCVYQRLEGGAIIIIAIVGKIFQSDGFLLK